MCLKKSGFFWVFVFFFLKNEVFLGFCVFFLKKSGFSLVFLCFFSVVFLGLLKQIWCFFL